IAEAHQKHSGTVELLNEYLQDEYEDSLSKVKTEEINSEEVQIEIQKKETDFQRAASKFADAQRELLDTFQKNGLTLSDEEIELFAKSRGLFKNQLIESLNDTCYEILDDLLIEEDGENYSINPDYFQRILTL
ncbi:MAG: tellurite resistance TerB C-terminal domain-containing protein, partial [Bacteroidota bacterium]